MKRFDAPHGRARAARFARFARIVVGIALPVWLALLSCATRAFVDVIDTPPALHSETALHQESRLDCCPCAACCTAPVPAAHSFSGESREASTPTWHVLPRRTDSSARTVDTRGRRTLLPVRIAFCRWLD